MLIVLERLIVYCRKHPIPFLSKFWENSIFMYPLTILKFTGIYLTPFAVKIDDTSVNLAKLITFMHFI